MNEQLHPIFKDILDRHAVYPSQCSCGHIYFEQYEFKEPNKNGEVGFCWCGFCRKKKMVKPIDL